MLTLAMPARRPGRPPLGTHPMTAGERRARSRQVVRPDTVQLNVEVAAEVRDALRALADKLYPRIRGRMVPADTFDEVFMHLKAFRATPGR